MPEVAFPEGYQRALVTGATSGIGKALPFAQKVNEAGCVLNLTTKITS